MDEKLIVTSIDGLIAYNPTTFYVVEIKGDPQHPLIFFLNQRDTP